MAVTKDQLLIEISANVQGATSGIKSVTDKLGDLNVKLDDVSKSNKETESALTGLGATFVKLSAATNVMREAFSLIGTVMEKTVGEFQKSKDNAQELANTLALMGEKNVKASMEKFLSLAEEIGQTTIVDDDTVIKMAKLGVAAGRTDAQIEKMIKTAVDISSIDGSAPAASMEQLLNTYKGMGKSLETLSPELRNLTQAQLMAGEAVDVLSAKFEGFGKAASTTFSGSMSQLKNTFSDAMKEIGHILNAGFGLDEGVSAFSEAMKGIVSTLKENGAAIAAIVAEIKQAFMNFINGVIVGFGFLEVGFGQIGKFVANLKGDLLGMTADDFDKVQDEILTRNQELMSSMKLSATAGEEAFKKYGEAIKETAKIAGKGDRKEVVLISDEAKGQLKELHDKMLAYQDQAKAAGKSEFEQIQLKAKAELDGLKILEKKLIAQRALTDAAKQDLELARKAIAERAAADRAESSRKVLQTESDKTKSLQSQVEMQNKTPLQQAQLQRKRELEDIEKQRQEYIRQGRMVKNGPQFGSGAELEKQLNAQQQAVNSKQMLGHNDAFNQAKDIGDQIASSMGQAMDGVATGMMGAASSVLGAAQGAIDMAQSLVDAIPKLLFSFAHLVDSLTDLPNKLAEGIGKVLTSILNMIKNLIPNLLKAVSTIIESVIDFIMNLPQAFADLFNKSADILFKFADNLPDMAERLVMGIIKAVPKIVAKLAEFLIIKAPEIAWKLAYALAFELPPAIIHGIAEGLKEFGRIWQRWMKGQFSDAVEMKVDTAGIKKQFAQITNDTSKIFSVEALSKGAKNAENITKQLADNTAKAGKSIWKYFIQAMRDGWKWLMEAGEKIWNGLKTAAAIIGDWGTKIWDGLVAAATTLGEWGTKIWNGLKEAAARIGDWGTAIWNALKAGAATIGDWGTDIWNGLKAAATTLGEWGTAIWNGLLSAAETIGDWGKKIWDGLTGAIGDLAQTLGGWGKAIWDGLTGAIGDIGKTLGDWGGKIWTGFTDKIGDAFTNFGKSISSGFSDVLPSIGKSVESLFTNLGNSFKKLFQFDMSGIASSIEGAFNAGSNMVKDAFKTVFNPLIDMINGIIDALNWIKIPEVSIGVPRWAGGGSWKLWGETDLLPGEIGKIAKLATGGQVMGPGGIDNVPALLTAGEFVINKDAAAAIGLPNLAALNAGKMPGQAVVQNISLNLTIENKDRIDENFVRQRIMPALKEELKRGSLDGRAVVYAGGVRK